MEKRYSSLTTGLAAKRVRFGWLLALTVGFWAVLVQAEELRYHYVALDQAPLPARFVLFGPEAINQSGRVYGEAYETCFSPPCRGIPERGRDSPPAQSGQRHPNGQRGGDHRRRCADRSGELLHSSCFVPRLTGGVHRAPAGRGHKLHDRVKRLRHGASGLVQHQLGRDPRDL